MITEINGKAAITSEYDDKDTLSDLREELILLMWQITEIGNTPNALDALAKIIYIMGDKKK